MYISWYFMIHVLWFHDFLELWACWLYKFFCVFFFSKRTPTLCHQSPSINRFSLFEMYYERPFDCLELSTTTKCQHTGKIKYNQISPYTYRPVYFLMLHFIKIQVKLLSLHQLALITVLEPGRGDGKLQVSLISSNTWRLLYMYCVTRV